ncbi:MAG: REP-associated tyrosine transposase [Acidobacteriaceae bacterium]
MPLGLRRNQRTGETHCVTFSCYHRLPLLGSTLLCEIFLQCLERTRRSYQFRVYGYVVMPEHIHLLISEPETELLATAIQALKIASAARARHYREVQETPLWQKRYFDHNVRSHASFETLLRYIHRNPVKRRLVIRPEDWKWSSFRHYSIAETGPVEIESQWTADRRSGRIPRLLSLE